MNLRQSGIVGALLMLAIILLVAGFEGNIGAVLAVLVVPDSLEVHA